MPQNTFCGILARVKEFGGVFVATRVAGLPKDRFAQDLSTGRDEMQCDLVSCVPVDCQFKLDSTCLVLQALHRTYVGLEADCEIVKYFLLQVGFAACPWQFLQQSRAIKCLKRCEISIRLDGMLDSFRDEWMYGGRLLTAFQVGSE